MYESAIVVSTLFVVVIVKVALSSSKSVAVAPASVYMASTKTVTGLSPSIVITGDSANARLVEKVPDKRTNKTMIPCNFCMNNILIFYI